MQYIKLLKSQYELRQQPAALVAPRIGASGDLLVICAVPVARGRPDSARSVLPRPALRRRRVFADSHSFGPASSQGDERCE